MRTPTFRRMATQLRRRTVLGFLSIMLAAGLTGCAGAGATEPDLGPSVDPAPVPLRQAHVALVAATGVSIQPVAKSVLRQPGGIDKRIGAPRGF